MVCQCKNEDGTLSDRCYGTCLKDSIVKHQEDAKRDPLNGFAELILGQVEERINNRLSHIRIEFQKEQFNLYKEAYIDGLKEGIEIGKCHYD